MLSAPTANCAGPISATTDAFKADSARCVRTRAVAKHGALFAIAYAVNFPAGLVMIAGILVLAHTA